MQPSESFWITTSPLRRLTWQSVTMFTCSKGQRTSLRSLKCMIFTSSVNTTWDATPLTPRSVMWILSSQRSMTTSVVSMSRISPTLGTSTSDSTSSGNIQITQSNHVKSWSIIIQEQDHVYPWHRRSAWSPGGRVPGSETDECPLDSVPAHHPPQHHGSLLCLLPEILLWSHHHSQPDSDASADDHVM